MGEKPRLGAHVQCVLHDSVDCAHAAREEQAEAYGQGATGCEGTGKALVGAEGVQMMVECRI